ncbi:lipopolysaccharide biosynthesis protein [Rossellomorea marisflavi]|uniref:lipopolysaccharide biosynthesis protein n=1 Tax=Rossellomorea marisflavi TaxID=189381 RepID=UPI00207934F9|nr:lipopolysaccharide biosynthesis protein [Rossellomorea marisflavi]USK91799.1 lipopolysaccharide biosynthesis protein [Rossellomorea marisflavi]
MKAVDLGTELKKGLIITFIGKYSYFAIQLLILALLSRILTPEEFGIVAIVNVFIVFFSMLIDMGIGPAIIQNKTLKKNNLDSIFVFSVTLSAFLSLIFVLLSPYIASFYSNNELIKVCIAMSAALFTSGLNMVPQAVLLKSKRFLEINIAQVISSLVSGIVGVTLALAGFSYYSIIISLICKNFIFFIFIFRKSNLSLVRKFTFHDIKPIYSFSRNQFLFNLVNFFSRNLDNLLIGKFLSLKALGYYDKAYTMTLYPNQILTNVINPVVQPIMSQHESNPIVLKNTYFSISRILGFIGIPLSVYLYFNSKEVIFLFFGNQWAGSVGIFKILSVSVCIQLILSSTGAFFQSANRTDLLLVSGILSTCLNILSIIIGVVTKNIEYLAFILVIGFMINFVQAHYLLLKKVFFTSQKSFYAIFKIPLLIGSLVFGSLWFYNYATNIESTIINLVFKSLITIIIFSIIVVLTGNKNLFLKLVKRGR